MTQQESFFNTQLAQAEQKLQGALLQIEKKDHQLKHYESEVERLHEMLRDFKRMKFGPKTERWESEDQITFFNEAEMESKNPEVEESTVEVKGHTKKRGHRKALPADLPREIVLVELPPEERFAEDGTPLVAVGKEVSEKFFFSPSQMKVIEYHRIKYGVGSGDYVKTAPPVPMLIPKGIATSGLIAQIVVQKYCDGLPLYRQEDIFKRMGIDLPRSTQGRWVVQSAEASRPVWNILQDRLLENFYVSCDESHFQVLKEKDRDPQDKSWIWVRSTPHGKNKIAIFDYDPSRSGKVAERLLEEFAGILQVDGYAGYNILEKQEGLVRIGCNMHGRRYFEKALKIGAKSGQSLAEVAMKFYKQLYDIEEELRELDPEERHRLREEKHKPIWFKFKQWAEENHKKVPPRSKIGEAFHYFLNEYEYLIGYLRDGRLEMDNGFVERMIRKFAIGRNNWLFSDTEAGAEASCIFYSLVITAKINSVNPYKAIRYLFDELPKAKTIEDYERLADVIMGVQPIG